MTGHQHKTQPILLKTDKPVHRVMIAEDSATIRYHLSQMIDETPGITVVGEARDGIQAVRMAAALRPDVISMDIRMPQMDGLEATRRIMANTPMPVVVVSGLVERDVQLSVRALEAGALAVVEKPPARNHPTFDARQTQLVRTLAAMAGVSVVRRGGGALVPPRPEVDLSGVVEPELIAIGASAGGPSALSKVLGALPAELPVPVVIVQHIPAEFVPGLARWLDKLTPLRVQMATDYGVLMPGVVYLAPGNQHLLVTQVRSRLIARLSPERGASLHQPSIDMLFESVAVACGPRAIGVILTGMGDDGASGLLAMRQAGAQTMAQDQASSTVYGMPAAAVALGAVEQTVNIRNLPAALLHLM